MGWLQQIITSIINNRFWTLARKEIWQIFGDRQMMIMLGVVPILQIMIFGLALSPNVEQISLGLIDYAQTNQSRELIAALVENDIFRVATTPDRPTTLQQQVQSGKIVTGLIIPPDFDQHLLENRPINLQVFLDGVDANTAGIASGYLKQIINEYNLKLNTSVTVAPVTTATRFLYNPGLRSSWFFVLGVFGLVLTTTGTLVSSMTIIREKDVGTLEQLLMTPASDWEILIAKIVPLFMLLMTDLFGVIIIARLTFGLPFRGNVFIFAGLSGLHIAVSIGIGMLLATFCRTQQQVMLSSFFLNIPLIQLSGTVTPIEGMPQFFRWLSWLNPLRHYVAIARSLILKGVAVDALLPHIIVLCLFAILLLAVSVNRFRSQLN